MTVLNANPMQDSSGINPKYICPRTNAPLHLDGDTLRTKSGECVYPIQAGIPQFLRFEPAEDEPTKAQLDRLNRLARENGWLQALRAVYGENTSIVRYVTQVERASFICRSRDLI